MSEPVTKSAEDGSPALRQSFGETQDAHSGPSNATMDRLNAIEEEIKEMQGAYERELAESISSEDNLDLLLASTDPFIDEYVHTVIKMSFELIRKDMCDRWRRKGLLGWKRPVPEDEGTISPKEGEIFRFDSTGEDLFGLLTIEEKELLLKEIGRLVQRSNG